MNITNIDDVYFKCILYSLNNIKDFINLKEVFPHKGIIINKSIIYLTSDVDIIVKLSDFRGCKNLIIASKNIIFQIDSLADLEILRRYQKIKHLNLKLPTLKNEYLTIEYLNKFLDCIPKKHFYSKTFRILFDIKLKTSTLSYAYIFDRKYLSVVNINIFRSINEDTGEPSRLLFYKFIEDIIMKHLIGTDIYYCVYNKESTDNYRNNEPVSDNLYDPDVVDKLVGNPLIFLIRNDSHKEIFAINKFTQSLVSNTMSKGPDWKVITFEFLYNILELYARRKKLLIDKNGEKYINIWDDKLFKNEFMLDRNFFRNISKKGTDYKRIAQSFVKGCVLIDDIVDLILNLSDPLDYLDKDKIHKVILPNEKSYINFSI